MSLQLAEDKREVYEKGQHLRGADAEFAEQTRAELVRQQLLCPLFSSVTQSKVNGLALEMLAVPV